MRTETPINTGRELLDLLVEGEHISSSVRAMLRGFMKRWEVSAFHAILMTAVMGEAELADALAECLSIDRLFGLRGAPLAESAARVIGYRRARDWECLALQTEATSVEGDADGAKAGRIDLVIADPTRHDRIAELRRELACELTLAVAERSDIVGAIDELFPLSTQLPSLFGPTRL